MEEEKKEENEKEKKDKEKEEKSESPEQEQFIDEISINPSYWKKSLKDIMFLPEEEKESDIE